LEIAEPVVEVAQAFWHNLSRCNLHGFSKMV
jgi:hypothetical protein